MNLIVGLGNPGKKYEATRHNIGWMILDALATKLGVDNWSSSQKFEADRAEVGQGDDKIILLKPITFMNNSGRSVERVRAYYKLQPSDIVVIHDELALPFGTVRIRRGGQTAGHNGIGSLIHHLGSEEFWRVRIGIENDLPSRNSDTTNFVLFPFTAEESTHVPKLIDETAQFLVQCRGQRELKEISFTIS